MSHKNIVVIGAASAGHALVNNLVPKLPTTHRIILIERNLFVLNNPTVVRAVVVPGWEKKFTLPLSQEKIFPADSTHKFVRNTVVELRAGLVVLEQPFEGSTELSFDIRLNVYLPHHTLQRCIIATGATQPPPMRPPRGVSEPDYLSLIQTLQSEISSAQKIVVVGGGPIGLEVTGEILHRYPDKSISLVHSDTSVLHPTADSTPKSARYYTAPPTSAKLSATIEAQLRGRGVQLFFSDKVVFPTATTAMKGDEWDGSSGALGGLKKVHLESGQVIMADYVFVGIGNRPNSELVEKVDPQAVTENKYVVVNEYLQVVTTTPHSPFKEGNYFALGDVASTPYWKTGVNATDQAATLAINIVNAIKGKSMKRYGGPMIDPMLISLGPGKNAGAGTLTVPLFGMVRAPRMFLDMKNKDFFAGTAFYGRFKGSEKVVAPA